MRSRKFSKIGTFSASHCHKNTEICTGCHHFKVVMTALSQAVHSGYQEPSSQIRSSKFVLLSLSTFSNAAIHSSHTSISLFRLALYTLSLSLYMYSNSSIFVSEYLGVSVSPSLFYPGLPRCGWQSDSSNFWFSSLVSTFFAWEVGITRSSMISNGSNENPERGSECFGAANDAGMPKTFRTPFCVFETSINLLCTAYPRWKNAARFPAKYLFQIHCQLFYSVIAASFETQGSRKCTQGLGKVTTMQTTLPRYWACAAVKNTLWWWGFGIMHACKYAVTEVTYGYSFLLW